MEETRRAIRRGRALATEGLYEDAKETWKAALRDAYLLQDYAGMFVLSLQEAKENLEYALQLVEKCSLRETLGEYRALYQGVRRAEILRRKVDKLLSNLQVEQEVTREKEAEVCTTCGVGDDGILMDENDGCYYCRKCYEEYYATVGHDAIIETAKMLVAVNDVEGEKDGLGVELCLKHEKGDASADLAELGSGLTTKPATAARFGEDEHTEETISENYETKADRIRHERVELGSLADFLAGTLQVGTKSEEPASQLDNVSNDTLVVAAATPAFAHQEDECMENPVATIDGFQEVLNEVNPATPNEGALHNEEAWRMDENAADRACDKRKYSVAELLSLRKHSPCDCPESLLESPVRDDGSNPAPNKVNNFRKKHATPAFKSPNKIDVAGSDQVKGPEKTDATLSVSLLPTMDL